MPSKACSTEGEPRVPRVPRGCKVGTPERQQLITTDSNWQQLHQVQRQLVGFLGFLGFPVTLLILFEERKQYFHQNYLDTSCYEVDLQLVMNSTRCVTRCIHIMCQIGCSVVDRAILLFKVSNGYLELWKRFARHFEMVHRCKKVSAYGYVGRCIVRIGRYVGRRTYVPHKSCPIQCSLRLSCQKKVGLFSQAMWTRELWKIRQAMQRHAAFQYKRRKAGPATKVMGISSAKPTSRELRTGIVQP